VLGDVASRVWSLFVGMLGGGAIIGILLVGHALFFDDGTERVATTGLTTTTVVPSSVSSTTTPAVGSATTQPTTPQSSATTDTTPTTPAPDTLGNDTPIDPNVNPLTPPPPGTVTLLDVFTEDGLTLATVMVDADSYNVGPGDTFGASYRLDAINGRCAQLRHGTNPFELCVGASTQT
jgi:hypothetical protein